MLLGETQNYIGITLWQCDEMHASLRPISICGIVLSDNGACSYLRWFSCTVCCLWPYRPWTKVEASPKDFRRFHEEVDAIALHAAGERARGPDEFRACRHRDDGPTGHNSRDVQQQGGRSVPRESDAADCSQRPDRHP